MYPGSGDLYGETVLYCTNPECGESWAATWVYEGDTNASYIPDEDYACPYCDGTGTEEKPADPQEEGALS